MSPVGTYGNAEFTKREAALQPQDSGGPGTLGRSKCQWEERLLLQPRLGVGRRCAVVQHTPAPGSDVLVFLASVFLLVLKKLFWTTMDGK